MAFFGLGAIVKLLSNDGGRPVRVDAGLAAAAVVTTSLLVAGSMGPDRSPPDDSVLMFHAMFEVGQSAKPFRYCKPATIAECLKTDSDVAYDAVQTDIAKRLKDIRESGHDCKPVAKVAGHASKLSRDSEQFNGRIAVMRAKTICTSLGAATCPKSDENPSPATGGAENQRVDIYVVSNCALKGQGTKGG